MKNIFKSILLIIVIATSFIACDDELELFPHDQGSAETAFKGEGDFTNAVRGMYRRMLVGTYYGGQLQGYDG